MSNLQKAIERRERYFKASNARADALDGLERAEAKFSAASAAGEPSLRLKRLRASTAVKSQGFIAADQERREARQAINRAARDFWAGCDQTKER